MWTLAYIALTALLLVNFAGLLTHKLSNKRYLIGASITLLATLMIYNVSLTIMAVVIAGFGAYFFRAKILSFIE